MASKALVTIGSGGFAAALRHALPSFEHYAERFGYDVVVGSGDEAEGRPGAWAKVRLLQDALARYELALWIDADALVVDASSDIADELPDGCFQALVEEHNGAHRYPNTGVWLLRASQSSQRFLEEVWESTDFIDHLYWEQGAVSDLLGYEIAPWLRGSILIGRSGRVRETAYLAGTHWLPRQWNNLVWWSPVEGGRINHYAGIWPLDRRLDAMCRDAERLPCVGEGARAGERLSAPAAPGPPTGDIEREWAERGRAVERELEALGLDGATFALADEENWREPLGLAGRARPFPERHGEFWGTPPTGLAAAVEVERARRGGAAVLVFAWPALWWLDHFDELREHLDERYRCIHRGELLVAYDLKRPTSARGTVGERLVEAGPFAGMLYPADGANGDPVVAERRRGADRRELLDALAGLLDEGYRTVACLGVDDGYVPVGIAVRAPRATIYAFDDEFGRRERCRRLAELNAVGEELVVQRRCTPALLERVAGWSTLVVAPDGTDPELLRPDVVRGLRRCTLLVRAPAGAEAFLGRFAATHAVDAVGTEWVRLEPRVAARLAPAAGGRARRPSVSRTIVTAADAALAGALEIAMPGFEAYADRFGYDLLVGEPDDLDGRSPQWTKIPVLRRALAEHELVLWLDADVIVADDAPDIANELAPGDYQALAPQATEEMPTPNTGVWLLRAGPRAERFLAAVWKAIELVDHAYADQAAAAHLLGWELPPTLPPPWEARGQLSRPARRVRESPFTDGTRLLAPEWNSLVEWAPVDGARIDHFAGIWPLERRIEAMRRAAGRGAGPRAAGRSARPAPACPEPSPATPARHELDWADGIRRIDAAIARAVPNGERFVLVDDDRCRNDLSARERAIPFTERDGDYWGPPPNDACAIVELERLRARGAAALVVAWPSSWWLDAYPALARHLRASAACVVEDDALVAFDLRAGPAGLPAGLAERVVREGPFAGMVYPRHALSDPPATLPPKLDGTYQSALHPILAAAVASEHELYVALGVDAGHYPVGIALRAPWARVWAFGTSIEDRAAMRGLARENGVSVGAHGDGDRIISQAWCDHAWLDAIADLTRGREPFVLCADEHRVDLLDPERAPAIRGYTLLANLGERVTRAERDALVRRLAGSHRVDVVPADSRPDIPSPVGCSDWVHARPRRPAPCRRDALAAIGPWLAERPPRAAARRRSAAEREDDDLRCRQ